MLKGLQLIAKASAGTSEEYLKHIWSNSTVRDVILNNCENAKKFTDKLATNPGNEFENVAKMLRETVERSSVVAESVKQYASSASNFSIRQQEGSSVGNEANSKGENSGPIGNLDISAITLKELEQYLSQKSNAQELKPELIPIVSKKDGQTPDDHTRKHLQDEKYVDEWMKFISKYEPANSTQPSSSNSVKPIFDTVAQVPIAGAIPIPKVTETTTPIKLPELSKVAKQRKVPSSRIGRMASFGTLFAGLGVGTVNSLAKGVLGLGGSTDMKSALFSPANAERIVDTLCRVRGAALKLGQILSIQDSTIVSPQLVKAFDRVRQAADYMPDWQVNKTLKNEFGSDWQDKFKSFDHKPFAAASIGQVHHAVLPNGMEVAVKIQYPGVAKSIESDIDNLVGMLKVWDVFPPGIFIDNVVKVISECFKLMDNFY